MNLKNLFRGNEHSDSVPLDVVSPVAELRMFLSGEIDREEYAEVLERSDEVLAEGWSSDDDARAQPAHDAPAHASA